MKSEVLTERLTSMTVPERIRALSIIYSRLTVCTRELFLPDKATGKEEQLVMTMLHGMNELHHTVANWLVAYSTDEKKAFPLDTLSRQLKQIATEYRIEGMLAWAVDSATAHQ